MIPMLSPSTLANSSPLRGGKLKCSDGAHSQAERKTQGVLLGLGSWKGIKFPLLCPPPQRACKEGDLNACEVEAYGLGESGGLPDKRGGCKPKGLTSLACRTKVWQTDAQGTFLGRTLHPALGSLQVSASCCNQESEYR